MSACHAVVVTGTAHPPVVPVTHACHSTRFP
jgi:hypothetical protein